MYPGDGGVWVRQFGIAVIAMFDKRYFAANQMKRVQRANGSLAQVWGRAAPNVLPAENMAKLIASRKSVLTSRRLLRSPHLRVPS